MDYSETVKKIKEAETKEEKLAIAKTIPKFFEYSLKKYGIKKLLINVKTGDGSLEFEDAFEYFDKIVEESRSTIKQEIFDSLCLKLTEDDIILAHGLITNTVKVGIGKVTVQSIVDTGNIKLVTAYKYSEKDEEKYMKYPACLQLKYDGERSIIVFNKEANTNTNAGSGPSSNTNAYTAYTRNSNIKDLSNTLLDKELKIMASKLDKTKTFYMDGELIAVGKDGKHLPREISNGLFNRNNITDINEDFKLVYVAWDLFPEEVYKQEAKTKSLYIDRLMSLNKFLAKEKSLKNIQIADSYELDDIESALNLANTFIEKGYEGAMLKSADFTWATRRTKKILKIKKTKECNLVVVGYNQGTGSTSEGIGSLIAESSDGILVSNVGGLTLELKGLDKNRKQVDPDHFDKNLKGKIINVEYLELVKKKDEDKYTLTSPMFNSIVYDRDEADNIKTIIKTSK